MQNRGQCRHDNGALKEMPLINIVNKIDIFRVLCIFSIVLVLKNKNKTGENKQITRLRFNQTPTDEIIIIIIIENNQKITQLSKLKLIIFSIAVSKVRYEL